MTDMEKHLSSWGRQGAGGGVSAPRPLEDTGVGQQYRTPAVGAQRSGSGPGERRLLRRQALALALQRVAGVHVCVFINTEGPGHSFNS